MSSQNRSNSNNNISSLIAKVLELNNEIFVLINKMLNSSFNIMDSNKVVYRTIFSSTLKLFAKQSEKIITGKDLDPIDRSCVSNFSETPGLDLIAWKETCYNDLLVDPILVIDLVKNSMLTQLNYISNDINSIIVNDMDKNDKNLSELLREILKYMKAKNGNDNKKRMNKYLESMITQNVNKESIDRGIIFKILTFLNEINDKSRKLTKYYELIRKQRSSNVITSNVKTNLENTFYYNLKTYQDCYNKLKDLFDSQSNSDNGIASFISSSSQTLSSSKLRQIKETLEYNSGLRSEPIKIGDKEKMASSVYNLIVGGNNNTNTNKGEMSNVSGVDSKNLLIYYYVFNCSTTAKLLHLYTKALKPANIILNIKKVETS